MTTERYTHGHHESVLRSHSWRTVENSASYLLPHLLVGKSLLDLGCGPGTITADFAQRLVPGKVTGLDSSDEIVAKATADFARDNLSFVAGSAYALPFEDDSFDIVHAHQVLQHVADPVAVLREMRRVAKPGGIVAARDIDYAAAFWYPLSDGMNEWLALGARLHRSNGGEPDAGRRLKAWAREAGFEDVVATASVWNFSSPADRTWWGGLWADRVLKSSFGLDALAKGLATQEDLERISRAWLAWADDEDGWLTMPHGEIIAKA